MVMVMVLAILHGHCLSDGLAWGTVIRHGHCQRNPIFMAMVLALVILHVHGDGDGPAHGHGNPTW